MSEASVSSSWILLGNVIFQMSLLYFLNWPRSRMRYHAWEVVCNTILIFCGVLAFTAGKLFIKHFYTLEKTWLSFIGLFLWVWVSQLVVEACIGPGSIPGKCLPERFKPMFSCCFMNEPPRVVKRTSKHLVVKSGVNDKWLSKRLMEDSDARNLTHEEMVGFELRNPQNLLQNPVDVSRETNELMEKEEDDRDATCYIVLMGHITGFAAINSFGFLQADIFGANLGTLVAFGGLCCWFLLWRSFSLVARRCLSCLGRLCPSPVRLWPPPPPQQHRRDEQEELEEEWSDMENDVIALACSLLGVLAFLWPSLNFEGGIHKSMTSEEAFEKWRRCWGLCALLFFVSLITIPLHVLCRRWQANTECFARVASCLLRVTRILMRMLTDSAAWLGLFAWDFWHIMLGYPWGLSCDDVQYKIRRGYFISWGSMLCIWLMTKVQETQWFEKLRGLHDEAGKDLRRLFHNIRSAMGLAIGFAWEQAYDSAVDDATKWGLEQDGFPLRLVTKESIPFVRLICAVSIILIFLPACRVFVMPMKGRAREDMEYD